MHSDDEDFGLLLTALEGEFKIIQIFVLIQTLEGKFKIIQIFFVLIQTLALSHFILNEKAFILTFSPRTNFSFNISYRLPTVAFSLKCPCSNYFYFFKK